MPLIVRWTLWGIVPLNVLLACVVASRLQVDTRFVNADPIRLVVAIMFLMHFFGFLIALLPSIAIKLCLPRRVQLGWTLFVTTCWAASFILAVVALIAPAALGSARVALS